MYTRSFMDRKHKQSPVQQAEVQYLALSSEPADSGLASGISFSYHRHYLAKRRLARHIRRLRSDQPN